MAFSSCCCALQDARKGDGQKKPSQKLATGFLSTVQTARGQFYQRVHSFRANESTVFRFLHPIPVSQISFVVIGSRYVLFPSLHFPRSGSCTASRGTTASTTSGTSRRRTRLPSQRTVQCSPTVTRENTPEEHDATGIRTASCLEREKLGGNAFNHPENHLNCM